MSDLIVREDAIMALRLEYPMMPLFKSLREEWAIKTEGFRKAEEVIMKLPSVDTPTTMTGVIDAIREAEYRGCMKAVEERPKGEWASVLAELHERFNALENEIRKASAEMSAVIREYVDRPKGEWMPIIEANEFGEAYQAGIYCSECGETLGREANFCPNCGASMREREGE